MTATANHRSDVRERSAAGRPLLRTVVALLVAAAAVLAGAPAAVAEDPATLGSSPVLDSVGALAPGEAAEIEQAASRLYEQHRVQLFVAYVDSFTGVSGDERWADATAELNGLGDDDVLLAVAVGDRQYQVSVADGFAPDDAQLSSLESDDIEPQLVEGDWAGAAVAAADGIGERLDAPTAGESLGRGATIVLAVLAVLVVLGIVVLLLVRRSRRRKAAEAVEASIDELATRAGSALVHADDAVRTSEQEVGFAEAQFGSDATGPFREALVTAKRLLGEAFGLQQRLDDAEPETDQERRDGYSRILQLCADAEQALDEKAEAFEQLRDLEKNAPEVAAQLAARIEAIAARIAPTRAILGELAVSYSPSAIDDVEDDADQAEDRLRFARDGVDGAREALTAGDTGRAAVLLRSGQQAAEQASGLLDAVATRAADLREAEATLAARLAEIRADVAQGRTLAASANASDPATAPLAQNMGVAIAQTEASLDQVERAASVRPNDPLGLLATLAAADSTIDAAVGGYRDAQAQRERERAALAAELTTARSRVSAAEDFIAARRGAVGSLARTRLTEAVRASEYAAQIAPTDPREALASAQRASALAQDALQQARSDTSRYASPTAVGSPYGGNTRGSRAPIGRRLRRLLPPLERRRLRRRLPWRRRTPRRRRPLLRVLTPLIDTTSHDARRDSMAQRQSIFGRIAQLAKANINALLDQAEDPQKMLDQMVRDYTESIRDAEAAIAQTIGNLRLLEDDYREDVDNAQEWGAKALAASRKADDLRSSGSTGDADKFDALAKVALQRQIQSEKEAKDAEPTIASQTEVVDKLKSGLNQMREKLNQLSSKRDELIARSKTVEAQSQVQDAIKSIDIMDPTSEVSRFEQKIRREEARVRGAEELASSSLDAQFESLEDLGEMTEVEARLAALKSGRPQDSIGS
jgi:phage shock protein A/uncharacterized membrane protein YgcG